MTEREKLMKSYEDLTLDEIRKTLDFVLALKAQRTHEPDEPLHQKDRQRKLSLKRRRRLQQRQR